MKIATCLSTLSRHLIVLLIMGTGLLSACKKDFLDKTPSKSLLVPKTIADFDALIDNINVFNFSPGLNEITSDDFYTTDAGWLSWFFASEKNAYIYADDIYQGQTYVGDWDLPYQQVFYCNIVLDGLKGLGTDNVSQSDVNRIKGEALFNRAFAFYNLAQLFCLPYDKANARSDLGIPIRLASDVNVKSVRASVEQTYSQIVSDLKEAESLLPVAGIFKTRPGKRAAEVLLARVFLSMEDYVNAEVYADKALAINNKLLDFNDLDPTSSSPFPQILPNNSDEVIFYCALINYSYTGSPESYVDPVLYNSYESNDLRKMVFYMDNGSGLMNFKGSYGDNGYSFCGLANDEVFLIKAEAELRNGKPGPALDDLNALLSKRYKTGSYTNLKNEDANELLKIILNERRKELFGRGLRWSDLRRLNRNPNYAVNIKHIIEGKTYTLAPLSNKYVFPIPEYEIKRSGIQQN